MDIVLVTSNKHKYTEAQAILSVPIERVDLDIAEIQAMDIYEVVKAKAESAYTRVGKTVIVEDVEIRISAWNGLPGPFVKWFNQTLMPAGIARLLRQEEDKSATVREVIDLYDGQNHKLFEGVIEGTIADEPRGESGFGFDPIFIPEGQSLTYGEMSAEQKNKISHRAVALRKLKNFLERGKR